MSSPESHPTRLRRLLTGRRVAVMASAIILVQWVVAHAAVALTVTGATMPAFGDGPYQLFNPLRRIAAGQRGGVDFQFFHGIGVPYLHYPLFALWGKDYHASELTRHVLTLFLYPMGYLAVFAAATRRFAPTLWLTAGALMLTDLFGLTALAMPGNSLMGVRAAAPFVLFAVLLGGLRSRWEAVAAGGLAGAALVLGTEHGVASIALLGTVWVGRAIAGHPAGRLWWPVVAAVACVVTCGGFLLAVGGTTGATAALRYGFVELPNDQFWYFGGQTPGTITRSVWGLLSDPTLMTHLGVAVALAVLVVSWARRAANGAAHGPVFLGGLAYGAVASIGHLATPNPTYLAALARIELAILLVLGWRAVVYLAAHPEMGPAVVGFGRAAAAGFLAVGVLAGPTRVSPSSAVTLPREVRAVRAAWSAFPVPHAYSAQQTQAHIGEMVRAIDADRAASGVTRPPVIWSTYAGLLEAHYGVFHPDADYIIHALGPDRRAGYLAAFRAARPDYVCTFRRAYWGSYEEWLQQTTWPFYEEVARNYEVLTRTWAGVLWRRRSGPWRTDATVAETNYTPPYDDGFPIQRPAGASDTDPLIVEIRYETSAPLASVPVIGKLPRYFLAFVDSGNTDIVTLPPSKSYGGTVSVVVRPVAGKVPWGWVATESLIGGRVRVQHVRVRALPPDVAAAVTQGLLDP